MKRILVVVCVVLFLASLISVDCATAADRFVNNNNGTITDTQTGLMWTDKDNGSDWPPFLTIHVQPDEWQLPVN